VSSKSIFPLPFVLIATYFLKNLISVDPHNKLQINSIVTMIIIILIIYSLISVFIIIKRPKISFEVQISYFLEALALLVIVTTTTINILALRGAPFVPGAIWGDLGAYLKISILFKNDLLHTQVDGYPQLWFYFVGLISKILYTEVVYIYKQITIFASIIFSYISLKIWQLSLGKILGTIFILPTLFSLITWRDFAHLMFVPIFILLIRLLISAKENKRLNKLIIKSSLLGIIFGLAMSLYYSNLYWALMGLSFLIITVSVKTKNFTKDENILIINFFCGFINTFLTFVNFEFISVENILLKFILLTLINLCVVMISMKLKHKLIHIRMITFLLGSFLIIGTYYFMPLDFYQPDGILNNHIFNPQIDLDLFGAVKFIIIYLGILFSLRSKDLRYIIFFLFTLIISSFLTKYYIIAQLAVTGNVGLFERADTILYHSWKILEVISLGGIVSYIYLNNKSKLENINFKNYSIMIFSILFAIMISHKLSEIYIKTFPPYNETVRWAHEVCLSSFDSKTIFPEKIINTGEGKIMEDYITNYCR
jgi:hypothetical protein